MAEIQDLSNQWVISFERYSLSWGHHTTVHHWL